MRLWKKLCRKRAKNAEEHREDREGCICVSEEAIKWGEMIAHDPVYHAAIIRETIRELGYIP